MNEPLTLVLSGLAGVGLGAFFFGGLWWTVRKGMASPRPALWFFGSLVVRTAMVLAGFYFVGGSDGTLLIICLLGFITARVLVMRLMRPAISLEKTTKEASHATHA